MYLRGIGERGGQREYGTLLKTFSKGSAV